MEDILELIPEESREAVKAKLGSYVKLDNKDTVAELMNNDRMGKGKPIFDYFQHELSLKNNEYKKKVLEEQLPGMVQAELAKRQIASGDKDTLKKQIEIETNPERREMLQIRLENLELKEGFEAEKRERTKAQLAEKLHKEAGELSEYAGVLANWMPEDVAKELIAGINGKIAATKESVINEYKGSGNTAPKLTTPAGKSWKDMTMAERIELRKNDPDLAATLRG